MTFVECETHLTGTWRPAIESSPTTKKRLPFRPPQPLTVVSETNAAWAVDFRSDALYGGMPVSNVEYPG